MLHIRHEMCQNTPKCRVGKVNKWFQYNNFWVFLIWVIRMTSLLLQTDSQHQNHESTIPQWAGNRSRNASRDSPPFQMSRRFVLLIPSRIVHVSTVILTHDDVFIIQTLPQRLMAIRYTCYWTNSTYSKDCWNCVTLLILLPSELHVRNPS